MKRRERSLEEMIADDVVYALRQYPDINEAFDNINNDDWQILMDALRQVICVRTRKTKGER